MSDTFSNRRRALLGSLLACSGVFAFSRAMADRGHMVHVHGTMHDGMHADAPAGVTRREAVYKIPSVTLVRQDGTKVAFPQEIDDGSAVVLGFIYTSCTTICPIFSQVFAEFQKRLGNDLTRTKLVSISIDPDYDTPARLLAYAKKFHAGAQWQHYTGTQQASIAMQRAFDVYRGDKMQHPPVTLLRAAPGRPWVRYEGFPTADMLLREYRGLLGRV